MSLILPLIFPAASLSGCLFEPAMETSPDITENILTGSGAVVARPVSLDEALSEMYSLMDDIDSSEGTRSAGRRNIGSVELLGGGNLPGARTRSGNILPDSLLYIVNFSAGGFAVLAADASLEPVIAITEAGELTIGDFETFPDDNSGYTLEDLWVGEDGDYLLGGVQPEDGTAFIARVILDYIISDPADRGLYTDPSEPGGPTPPGVTYTWHTTDWVVDNGNTRRKMIITQWHQDEPFDLYCPRATVGRASAGCVAIAVMQVMAFHKFPATGEVLYHGWHTDVAWDEIIDSPLKITPGGGESVFARLAAADISRHVGEGVNMWYDIDGKGASFATPNQAAKYLTRHGYNAHRDNGYEEAQVKTSILEGYPAILGGISNEKPGTRSDGKEKGGHAWVADGWMERYMRRLLSFGGVRPVQRSLAS